MAMKPIKNNIIIAINDKFYLYSLGCSVIGKLFKDSLPETFPVSFVCDSEVKPKSQHKSLARSSLPPGLFLMPSALGVDRLGVYTTNTIEGRVIFGPFKGKKLSIPDVANEADYSNSWDVSIFIVSCFASRLSSFIHMYFPSFLPPFLSSFLFNYPFIHAFILASLLNIIKSGN